MNYIGIDPSATATGLAYKGEDNIWSYMEASINDWKGIKDFLVLAHVLQDRDHVMIEGQFAGINPKNALLLATVKGRIVQIAVEIGYEIEQVMPTKWQYALLDIPPKAKSKARKKASIKRACEITGEDIKSDNIADAINIACYATLL